MTSFCSYFNQGLCRSCEWIAQAYPDQLLKKEKELRNALSFLFPFQLEPSVQSPLQGFRNRAKMVVTGTLENPIVGLMGVEDLDAGRELLHCPIHHPKLNQLITEMPAFIRENGLTPYCISQRTGELKGLILFYSPGSNEMYLRFVLRSRSLVARLKKLTPGLQSRFPELVCISANLQPIPHAILEGPEEIILSERKTIDHRLGHLSLKLAPQAFVQTNAQTATELYQTAASWMAEVRPKRALELFCGQGAFSFFAEAHADEWMGIEINPDAVTTANATARQLGLRHLKFIAADAAQVDGELETFSPELILVNPPRRGLASALSLIEKHRPTHLLYSSCSVESLATDLKVLALAYRLKRIQLFDLFPHTEHFETLVWMERY